MSVNPTTTGSNETLYRNATVGFVISGVMGLVVLANIGYPFVGVAGYLALVGASFGISYLYPGTLFDEGDERILDSASGYTLLIFAYGAAVVFPVLTVLYGFGEFEWTPFVSGAGAMLLAVFSLYYAISGYLYYRR